MEPCDTNSYQRIFYCDPHNQRYSTHLVDQNKYMKPACNSKTENKSLSSSIANKCKHSDANSLATSYALNQPTVPLLSLKKICLNFIVQNFHLVDYLLGFPEILGKEMFDACEKTGLFFAEREEIFTRTLKIFISAYKDVILRTINLTGKGLFLASYVDNLVPYIYLEEIYFSDCKIGNNHDALKHIGKLHCLKKLYLNNNNMSHEGVKNLTLHHRRLGKGLENLNILRLDNNKDMQNNILMYLESLPMLVAVTLDHVDSSNRHVPYISKDSKFKVCPNDGDYHEIFNSKPTETSGWATSVISRDVEQFEAKRRETELELKSERKPSFYGNRKNLPITNLKRKSIVEMNKQYSVLCTCSHKGCCRAVAQKRPADSDALFSDRKRNKRFVNEMLSFHKRPGILENLINTYSV